MPNHNGYGLILASFILSWPSSIFTSGLLLTLGFPFGRILEAFFGVLQFAILGFIIDYLLCLISNKKKKDELLFNELKK